MFCDPDNNFGGTSFKKQQVEMGCTLIGANKIHLQLKRWKIDC